ncbi:class I SAM-dependent methyltransferase [Rhizobium paranaense]|uniref:S-adenosylmethionine-diacylgycerolhomoserine-N-methyltransferase n=2 Tax=Rhizobium TaxID=379 RepID=A0A7W9D0T8_9HYPH|nr:S-adenosylmethionine-diacylgycerolhomoserine-N-methyltransferase [Rhizobium paranaense]PST62983.1 SAM-dependent methyltransferase [Rhizobium sp. SEMIA4064]
MSQADTGLQTSSKNHAGLMDGMYRYQRHIYDLTRKYYLFGRDRTIMHLNVPFGGSLLEVGCGTGRNMLLAHRRFPSAKLYGLDISQEMLISARNNFRGLKQVPDFRVADATAFSAADFGADGFDRVMISYALSMIPDWKSAIDASLDAVIPGGELHIVDFGQQERLPGWFRTMLKGWLKKFHVTPRADLRTAMEERVQARGAKLVFEEIGRGYAWRAVVIKPAA